MLTEAERITSGEMEPPPVAKLTGFNLRSVELGRAVLDMKAGPQHWNPMGGLYGGILCDLTDAAKGIAYSSTLAEGEAFATVELKINFLRPVKQGHLIAEGWVVSAGRTLGYTESEVRDDDVASSRRRAVPARLFGRRRLGSWPTTFDGGDMLSTGSTKWATFLFAPS